MKNKRSAGKRRPFNSSQTIDSLLLLFRLVIYVGAKF